MNILDGSGDPCSGRLTNIGDKSGSWYVGGSGGGGDDDNNDVGCDHTIVG